MVVLNLTLARGLDSQNEVVAASEALSFNCTVLLRELKNNDILGTFLEFRRDQQLRLTIIDRSRLRDHFAALVVEQRNFGVRLGQEDSQTVLVFPSGVLNLM